MDVRRIALRQDFILRVRRILFYLVLRRDLSEYGFLLVQADRRQGNTIDGVSSDFFCL